MKQIEQFNMSPRLRKKAQGARCCFEIFEVFSFGGADKAFIFLRFSVYCAIYKMNRGFEIFKKTFEIFLSNGDSGHYNTIGRGPKPRKI